MRNIINFFTASIQRKMFFSFIVVIILVLAMVAVWHFRLTLVKETAAQVVPTTTQIRALQDFGLTLSSIDANLERFFVIGGLQYKEAVLEDLSNLETTLKIIKNNTALAEETRTEVLATLDQSMSLLKHQIVALLNLEAANLDSRNMNQQIMAVYSTLNESQEVHQTLSAAVLTELQRKAREQSAIISNILLQLLMIGAIVTMLLAIILFGLTRSIATPLATLSHTATQIAQGDLGAKIPKIQQKDEVGQLATAFENMTMQFGHLIASLEERIAARTQRLEIVASLSERFSAILEVEELLRQAVNQIRNNFGYYHAHVYLLDESGQNLTVAEGTGEAGAELKRQTHRLSVNLSTSLIAQAARLGKIVSMDNVRDSPDWQPNPLLPDTYAEMAVPIILDGAVVGVLDVQADQVAGLDEGDASLLRSVANQVAVSIRNARLFETVETALAAAKVAQERYIEQAWQKSRTASQGDQYLYMQPNAVPLDMAKQQSLAKERQQTLEQNQAMLISSNVDQAPNQSSMTHQSLVTPIAMGGGKIGALQLHTTSSYEAWTENDLTFLETIAEQFAQTAENLRLFEETGERASREKAIREVTDKLRTAPNIDSLLEIAARELGQHLGVRHTMFALGFEGPNAQDNGTRKM